MIQALLWRSDGRMDRDRFGASDGVWAKIARLLPGKASDRGVTARDNRLFVEAVLWRVRTGLPWRALPDAFGTWNSVVQRFRRWVRAGVFERVFECLSGDPDFEHVLIDGTIVTAHQKASGARGGLGVRPSGARAADWPPRLSRWSMRRASWCASCSCPASATTWPALRR
jgi:transposase